MTNFLLRGKEGVFVSSPLSRKYGTLRKSIEMPSQINNERGIKSLVKLSRQHSTVLPPQVYVHKIRGGIFVARQIESPIEELSNLTSKIQEKTAENSKIPTTSRLELVTFERKPALTPQVHQYVGDILDETTKAIRGILKNLDKILESVSDKNNNNKTKEASLIVSRLNSLEKQLKLSTKKEKSLKIIQELASEGYHAAPILRRLIESEDNPDIYQEAANVLMSVLK